MNLVQLTKNVYKVESFIELPVNNIKFPVNTWLIKNGRDIYIVDTGVDSLVENQMKAAESLGSPKAVFLTHGHSDHIQGAWKWVETYNLPIYAHQDELIYINGQAPYPNKDHLEQNRVANIVQPLTNAILNKSGLSYYLTPGHSPGHVIFHHEKDNVVLCGDLFITSKDGLHPPIRKFSVDMNENIDSGLLIDEIEPNILSSSHGEDLHYHPDLYKKYVFLYRD
ncbi:MBL fold metallo-hydrolase [Halobacillus rhizosphaerae]|uniref:MBL fold metallo-hydrolase n=1 Tax=Halobacillus rhizosphaerae TaxID=3064889 RepID=UPI00398AC878